MGMAGKPSHKCCLSDHHMNAVYLDGKVSEVKSFKKTQSTYYAVSNLLHPTSPALVAQCSFVRLALNILPKQLAILASKKLRMQSNLKHLIKNTSSNAPCPSNSGKYNVIRNHCCKCDKLMTWPLLQSRN